MKKKDIYIVGVILLLAAASWLAYHLMGPAGPRAMLRITVDGEELGRYDLEEEQDIPIGNTNLCRIRDGRVTMTEATCPDHLCIRQKAIDIRGGTIVCLPNKVVLDIVDGEETGELDAVT